MPDIDGRSRRLFIGLRPPDPVILTIEQHLGSRRTQRENLRWSRREQWHVTLRFLGATTEARSVAHAMAAATARISQFSMQFGGFGAFPSPMRATTLWLGVAQGGHRIAAAARALNGPLERMGFAADRRPDTAHLTVCRLKDEADARLLLNDVAGETVGPRFSVTELVLFESVPDEPGNRYVPLAVAALAPDPARSGFSTRMLDRTDVR